MDAPETANAAHAWPKEIAGLIARLIRLAALRALLARLSRRRLPVLLQGNAVECGIACLAMVLGYHGRRTRVSELSARIGVGRDGLTAAAIAAAARSYGLMVKSYSLSPADLAHLPLPAIAHWQFNHFVVIERWSPKGVTIVDPAMGRRRLRPEEFDAGFTGVVLTFVPGTHFQQAEKIRAPWRRHLGPYVLGHPGVLLQILGASLLLQILGLALPVFSKVLIDDVLPLETTDVLTVLGIGAVILVLAQAVTTYLRSALLVYLQARVDQRIMLGFFEHLLALPYRFFEQRGTGDLLMRLGSNALIRETLTSQTLSTVLDGSLAVGYLAFLLVQDALLGSLVLTVGLLQVALLILSSRRVHDLNQRELVAEGASQGYLVEALAGIATLKASGAEDRSLDRWSDLFVARLNVAAQRGQMSAAIEAAMTGLRAFAPLGLLWVGASQVLDGTLSLGTMLALQAVAVAALAPLTSLVTNGQRLQLVAAHLDRIAEVLDAEPEQDPTAFKPAPTLSGQIELESVSFRYDPRAPWTLQDISLKIDAGQKVALVGRTGSGKSTLAKLLLGLYSPTAGEIRYDGHPASGLELRSLRRQFGVVLQEPTLFGGSIRENIAFGDPGLSFERMVDAARMAEIHDEIMAVPMGYETRIAEGGAGFSGGQRQRIVLARALAQQPSLLLLDEATSSLDVATEAAIERNLTALACTRIVIAHRLSTVRDADLILVLDQGRIVERGTHEELLLRAGHYANLVRHQLAESAVATATVS